MKELAKHFNGEEIPEGQKTGKVVPVFKKGDKDQI